jgi:hypothetical protein
MAPDATAAAVIVASVLGFGMRLSKFVTVNWFANNCPKSPVAATSTSVHAVPPGFTCTVRASVVMA